MNKYIFIFVGHHVMRRETVLAPPSRAKIDTIQLDLGNFMPAWDTELPQGEGREAYILDVLMLLVLEF